MDHVPFKHKRTSLERIQKFISTEYFTNVNLTSRQYLRKAPLQSIKHTAVPGRIPYADVLGGKYEFKPVSVGQSFGPVWSTHWFVLDIKVPESWKGQEVHLLWNSSSEALVFEDGKPVQGLSADFSRTHFVLDLKSGLSKQLYIEMACNGLFGIGDLVLQTKEHEAKTFALTQAEIAVFDRDIYNLLLDFEALHDIAKELPDENQRAYQAMYTANQMINSIKFDDRASLKEAHEKAMALFRQKNGETQHTLYTMGHAHMDTAWLWPYDETKRKCARSWSCSLRLMKKFKDFKFVCSQAQQYEWVKTLYPSIWKDIKKAVKAGQFVPVGGTWVEMDGNIPSGEAFIRQFVYGQNFFMKEFGLKCKEFWLPDTFGYSAQLPQIIKHCAVTRFLTQKLSWSLVNKFPHSTFYWEGIDGSDVLTHFPPADDYGTEGKVKHILKSATNFKDKGRSNVSAFLFGFGDGGNGPSEDMLHRLDRFKDCDGFPKIKMATADELFSAIEKENSGLLCKWKGELYLELHNGTYTTWSLVKKYNRLCEVWLRDLELLATMASLKVSGYKYPKDELDRMWKLVLINQFHDVLPGSSITQVFKDAIAFYEEVDKTVQPLISHAGQALAQAKGVRDSGKETYVVNTQPFIRHEVIEFDHHAASDDWKKREVAENNLPKETVFVEVHVPAMCVKALSECEILRAGVKPQPNSGMEPGDVYLKKEHVEPFGECYLMDNGIIRACIDMSGRVLSLQRFHPHLNRWTKEAIDWKYPCNQYVIYDDVPLYWDAWDVMDYHLETRQPIVKTVLIAHETNKLRACIEVMLDIDGDSSIKQKIILDKGSPLLHVNSKVTWKASHKFLKVEFPTTVHATEVTYDIQSGFLRRPNHYNTSWDSARFEVCGHKWADISEHGFGVSILNDCKYGWSAEGNIIRLSLLRAPKSPDPTADMGVHTFNYAILPHFGSFQESHIIQEAIAFNNPMRTFVANPPANPIVVNDYTVSEWITVDTIQVVLQAVKLAEDGSGDVILRFHESYGGSSTVQVNCMHTFASVDLCNGLEEIGGQGSEGKTPVLLQWQAQEEMTHISFDIKPFQIVTVRCKIVS